jgi:hypothetical protein
MAGKHRWTPEENRVVCEEYVQHYLIANNSMSADEFVANVLRKRRELDSVDKDTSLVMKIYNTKSLVEDLGLSYRDSFMDGRLPNYSQLHKRCMLEVLDEFNIPY